MHKAETISRYWFYPAQVLILAAIYFGAAKLGLSLASVKGIVTLVWPPTGIALAALLLFGYRLWPGIALGAFLVNVSAGASLAAVGISAGNTLEAVTGVYLLHRCIGFHNSLDRLRDVLGLIGLAVVISTIISATIGAASLSLAGIIPWTAYGSTWWVWWLGDAMGALLVTPVLLTWGTDFHIDWQHPRPLEAIILLVSLITVSQIVFSGWLASYVVTTAPLSFTLFPFLVWAALRFGQRGAVTTTLIGTGMAVWGMAHGFGPFVLQTVHLSLIFLSSFMGAVAATAMLLAAAITERKRAEETLKTYARVLESMAEGVVVTDEAAIIFFTNSTFDRMFGYERGELIGQPVSIINASSPEESAQIVAQVIEQLHTKGVYLGEFNNRKKDGTEFTTYARLSALEVSGKQYWISVQEDITERKSLEEQFRQAQKMEAIGRLSGGVAHDFNNLLVVINGYSELLLDRRLPEGDPSRKHVEEIAKAGERAAALTRQLLAFSRQQVLQPRVLNLNEVVADMKKMLGRLIGEDVELIIVCGQGVGQIKADQGQLEQVIMNLVVNARDSMPHGGKLIIETANTELDEMYAREHLNVTPGLYVMLAVSDTGSGMDAQTRSHIFEPFFTTKEKGKGTGLGLATVYGIVKQSGGDIWVYSESGRGTTFKIYLPRVEEISSGLEPLPTLSDLLPGEETILLVEDEEAVRNLARQSLELGGYTVLTASQGTEALLLCEQQPGPIHLVVTDVVMPGGVNGQELAERLKALRPGLKVLFISGYTDETIIHYGVLETGLFYLQKPFTPNTLLRKVREVLDAP